MFDLERKISEWRRQMLAAGIQAPVPLEELESHLREEIAERVSRGAAEVDAFDVAVAAVGNAEFLRAEFRKAGGFWGWLGDGRQARINRTFALLWLALCSLVFFGIAGQLAAVPFFQNVRLTLDLCVAVLIELLFLRGIVASIRLFGGNTSDVRILKALAAFGIGLFVIQIVAFSPASSRDIAFTLFNIASLWLMRSPKKLKPAGK